MKLVTAEQMRKVDQAAIDEFGVPSLTLMERAGGSLADFAAKRFKPERGPISVLVGKGNNGGDGLVAARLLIEKGFEVLVFLTSSTVDLSPDARANLERLALLTPTVFHITSISDLKAHYLTLVRSTLIIDALLGTGLSSEVKSPYREIIEFVNQVKIPILAADIPSGLSADTGRPMGLAVKARWTVTFGLPKVGLFTGLSSEYTRHVKIADIGIPKELVDRLETKNYIIDPGIFKNFLPERKLTSHKGDFGHVAVIAGSEGKLGAGYLTSLGALRTGCGLVTYILPEKSFTKFDARYPEVMAVGLPDKGRGHFHPEGIGEALELVKDKTVVALGPAIGTHQETQTFVTEFVKRAHLPLVIDADGLNVLTDNLAILDHRVMPTIITPHPGEMERLVKTAAAKKEEERLPLALKLAASHKIHVVLKGHRTIIATPQGEAYINHTGNPAMASAGMGDTLTGMIAGFLAQGLDPTIACVAAVYCHGLAGDLAAKQFGDRGIVASDVIKCFPEAIHKAIKNL